MAHKKQISPSLMCADLLNLGAELKLLEKAGIEYLHIDIMDGSRINAARQRPKTASNERAKKRETLSLIAPENSFTKK